MKEISAILATSHVDLHNEQLTLGALKSMVRQIQREYIPMQVQHDPRIPPIGRIASARLKHLGNGSYAVEGKIELFELGDEGERVQGGRELKLRRPHSELEVVYDRSFLTDEDQAILTEIGELLGSRPQEEAKKALEPVSVLTLAGLFTLGQIAKGFLGKLGADACEAVKLKVTALFERRRRGKNEAVLLFRAFVKQAGAAIQVEVFVTNPSGRDVEDLLGPILGQLDRILPSYFQPEAGVRRLVFELSASRLEFRFGVDKRCLPLAVR